MLVKLISVTKPNIEGIDTAEDFVAYTARVSNPNNQMNTETSGKLLQYLIKNSHWSPFEMCHVVMEINTTRDIARQILRHRSLAFQEFSQRYADASQLGFTYSEARLQDTKNRQNSIEIEDKELQDWWLEQQVEVVTVCKEKYQAALDRGMAKEVARKVLPEGLTNSRLYMSGSLRSWIHYIQIRADKATQKEHRLVAEGALEELRTEFPSIVGLI